MKTSPDLDNPGVSPEALVQHPSRSAPMVAATGDRQSRILAARIRALYRSYTSRTFIVGFSTYGALLVLLVCQALGKVDLSRAVLWLVLVAAADIGLTVLDRRFKAAAPPDAQLEIWGWARALALGVRSLSWSFGPIIMHTHDDLVTAVVPVWGIMNLTAASAYTAAPFIPCLIATAAGGILPAASWLALQDSSVSRLSALLLVLALPFIYFLGRLGRRNVEALILGRLDLVDVLEQQKQQTRMVAEAMAERTRFFGAVSHDLRQPLQALGFYSSVLSQRVSDPKDQEIVERLNECVSSLERQFNAIIDVGRTDEALRRAKPARTSLQRLFERVVVSVRHEAELKGLDIRLAPTRLWVNVVPEFMERVLVNLATNAIRYTPKGSILIGVRRRGSSAEIQVLDTGIGISNENQRRIFDEFFQINNPERSRDQGSGLGLSIVRRLCIGLGWQLACSSQLGKGSCFSITVPICASAEEGGQVEPTTSALGEGGPARIGVVIIDDDALIRDAMKRLIASWGSTVEAFEGLQDALDYIERRDQSLLWLALVDYRLPGDQSGLAAIEYISRLKGAKIRTVLMTAETDPVLFSRAKQLAVPVLRKPLKPILLRTLVTNLASGAPVGDLIESSPAGIR